MRKIMSARAVENAKEGGKMLKKQIELIRGMPASRGTAEGQVVIVNCIDDIKKFQEGMIIVAPYTSPIYVPIMIKAKAIITDEGGILSHAAIVSRELKIPCVVGTKNATMILKDGEKVKVDGNEGVVIRCMNEDSRYKKL